MQGDSTRKHVKNLDIMLGAPRAVVIIDDTEGVWPEHRDNLILVVSLLCSSSNYFSSVRNLGVEQKNQVPNLHLRNHGSRTQQCYEALDCSCLLNGRSLHCLAIHHLF